LRVKQLYKNVLLWSVILVMFVAFYQFFNGHQAWPPRPRDLIYGEFAADVMAGKLKARDIAFDGSDCTGHFVGGQAFRIADAKNPTAVLLQQLSKQGTEIRFEHETKFRRMLFNAYLPVLGLALIVLLFAVATRRMRNS
jgi:cell division protease FtsH